MARTGLLLPGPQAQWAVSDQDVGTSGLGVAVFCNHGVTGKGCANWRVARPPRGGGGIDTRPASRFLARVPRPPRGKPFAGPISSRGWPNGRGPAATPGVRQLSLRQVARWRSRDTRPQPEEPGPWWTASGWPSGSPAFPRDSRGSGHRRGRRTYGGPNTQTACSRATSVRGKTVVTAAGGNSPRIPEVQSVVASADRNTFAEQHFPPSGACQPG